MDDSTIFFHEENISFVLSNEQSIVTWLTKAITDYDKTVGEISFIFTTDEDLHKINVEHLNHDTLTDVITFDYCEDNEVSGDIYISIDRVKENAESFSQTFDTELHRVLIHSTLHLLGYKDKSPKDKKEMTLKEDFYLTLLPPISS
ncbi:MAG: rRNA maturation RNase YbeY [Flavobacteriales bacterium]|nr:rRNA maturation RNase YbeY [Flavobacteriales bacterium]